MPHRVLVVDDQPRWTELVGLLIELDERFELAGTAADGFEALSGVRSDPPDAVVCDVNMPVLDGLGGALPALRASCPSATIAMYTSDPAGAGDAVDLGADAVVDKATDPATLLDLLAQMRERNGDTGHAQVGCGSASSAVVLTATDQQRAQRN